MAPLAGGGGMPCGSQLLLCCVAHHAMHAALRFAVVQVAEMIRTVAAAAEEGVQAGRMHHVSCPFSWLARCL